MKMQETAKLSKPQGAIPLRENSALSPEVRRYLHQNRKAPLGGKGSARCCKLEPTKSKGWMPDDWKGGIEQSTPP